MLHVSQQWCIPYINLMYLLKLNVKTYVECRQYHKSGVANLISENDPKDVKNYEVMDKKWTHKYNI